MWVSTGRMKLLSDLPGMNTVLVGGLYQKPSAVHALLARSVRAVVHEHIFEGESTLSIMGSCTLVSHRQQGFVITTRHQLNLRRGELPPDGHFDTLRFTTTEDGYLKNVPVDRCFYEESNADQEYHDLLFFGVERNWLRRSADRPYFLPLQPFSADARVMSFFYGHPVSKSEITHEPLHAFVRTAYIDGQLDRDFQSNAEHLRRYTYLRTDYEMDGFSGGAAFSLIGSLDSGLRVALDGIIVMAGSGYAYVVDANYLVSALSAFGE